MHCTIAAYIVEYYSCAVSLGGDIGSSTRLVTVQVHLAFPGEYYSKLVSHIIGLIQKKLHASKPITE